MTSQNPDPLADALNSLHESEDENQLKSDPIPQEAASVSQDAEEELDLGHFPTDDVDGSTQDLSEIELTSAIDSGTPRPRPVPRQRLRRPTKFHHAGVKFCLVVGMLLLIPALWAVAILIGLNVPMANRSSAHAMAYFMLVCWPVAGALIGGAIYFTRHLAKVEAMVDAAEAAAQRP